MRWAQEETETEVDASAAAADAVAGVAVAPDGFPLLAFPDDAQLTALRDQRERESREAAEAMLEQARIELLDRWQELQAEGVETVGHAPSVTPVVAAGHDRLQAVMSAAPDAILSFDAAGRILTCNPATERLFDAPQAEVVGSAVDRWLPGLVLPQPVADDSPHGEVREAVAHTAGGREFIAEVAISFVDHDGGRLGAAVLRDVTERKRYEAELQRLNATLQAQVEETHAALQRLRETQQQLVLAEKLASLGSLVAGVAHEVNTPVGIAVTAASHLAERTQEFAAASDAGTLKRSQLAAYTKTCSQSTQIILGNLERAAQLVQSFKRVAVDQSSEDAREIAVADYFHEVLTHLQPRLRSTRLRVVMDCDPALHLLTIPGAWSQILTNLVLNALDHAFPSGAEGQLCIAVRRHGERIEVCVADDGSGIAPEVLPKVFDPFFTTRRGEGGSGLGLHIVFNLVHQTLGGTVRVESRPGDGTRFIIDCPAKWSSP